MDETIHDYDIYISAGGSNPDPLDVLFLSAHDLARQIARVLKGRVTIEYRHIHFADTLNVAESILCYFLALRVMALTNRRVDALATPFDVAQDTGIVGNSIRPVIKRLVEQRMLQRVGKGMYEAKITALHNTEAFLSKRWGRWK